jgi:nicotinamidase-related amidase
MNVALLIIDVQKAFDNKKWGKRNNLNAEKNMLRLLNEWRQNNMPVINIQHASTDEHSPLHPTKSGYDFKDGFEPHKGEVHFTKNVNSAFIGTELEKKLKKLGCTDIVVIGLTTQHCVSTTTRMGANLGFHMHVIRDATAAFELTSFDGTQYSAEAVHHAALTNLHDEFATILTTEKAIETFITKKLLR